MNNKQKFVAEFESMLDEFLKEGVESSDAVKYFELDHEDPEDEKINHPAHYEQFRVSYEPADATSKLPHPLASAVEYILRAGSKEGNSLATDYGKAVWWLKRFVEDADGWSATAGVEPSVVAPLAAMCQHNYFLRCWFAGGMNSDATEELISDLEEYIAVEQDGGTR